VLGITRRHEGVFSEISEFLAKLLNGAEEVSMPLPGMSLDSYLLTKERRSRRFVNAVADKTTAGVGRASGPIRPGYWT
jgi:hypothetical protein